MNNFLNEIIELKKKRLAAAKTKIPLGDLRLNALAVREKAEKHRLQKALQKNQINIIAEIKRASPSKGIINNKIEIAVIAESYEKGGACAVSVLTEEDKFLGSIADLKTAQNVVEIPILRKDFIFDEYQIYEAADAGADAILLISAMLDNEVLSKLYYLAERELGLDVLVEIHTLEELEQVKKLKPKIIGVNNRDLHSFKVSLDVSRELIKEAPKEALLVAESGISTREDISELRELGFAGFLIGETLMRSGNIEKDLKSLAAKNTN
jgi:indole-3-glycerol phosphate synthase